MATLEQSCSLSIAEQAEDDAFQKRFTAECEHVWGREDYRVWACFACYDTADFWEGWE